MKLSINSKLTALLAVSALAMTGCQDEEFGYTASQIAEINNFKEVFGEPDPNHTWSTAAYRYITIDVQFPSYFEDYQCRVWTADPSRTKTNLYYMADLCVENGQSTKIGIDCPADLQTVYVSLTDAQGGTIVSPATFDKEGNARVVFGGATRAHNSGTVSAKTIDVYYWGSDDNDLATAYNGQLPSGSDGWGYFPKSKYDSFIKVFPENGGNLLNPPCSSFVFESKGEDLVLYPFYAVTDGASTNKIVFWVYNPTDNPSYSDIVSNDPIVLMPAGTMQIEAKSAGSFADYGATSYNAVGFTNKDTRSRPYVIHGVPAGWRIIFALESASEGYFYSIKELNDPDNSKSPLTVGSEFSKGTKYSMAGTATIGADTYLAFEDTWYNGMYDCQDMAFAVYGAKAVDMNVGGGEAMGFVVAYEDLGSTLDMDYNDIVLRVEHVTNSSAEPDAEKDVTVSLLAAGGTIPVVPMYKESAIFAGKGADSGSTGEAHTVFGFSTDTPVNAGGSTASATPVNSTIRVKEISPITTVAADIVMQLDGGTKTMKYTNPESWGVTYPEDGKHNEKVPYAILISDPNWKWPAENVLISSVYPSFKDWVKDQEEGINWYGAEWSGSDADEPATGDVVGIIALTTFYESQSIANINPEFLSDYCANGTTLYFVFENATPGATFTVKSETGTLTKEGTVGANGKAEIVLTGDEFKKILYKNGANGETNTYYTITVFASKYGVSFGSEAEFIESDINGTNVISDLIPEDGEIVSIEDNKLANSIVTSYEAIQFTIRAEKIAPSAALKNVYGAELKKFCGDDGYLSTNATAVPGRPGIYQISISKSDMTLLYDNTDLVFTGFTNYSVAIKGIQTAGLTASDITLGCNKTDIDLVTNGTIRSNSNGAITIESSDPEVVTVSLHRISTHSVSDRTEVTLTIRQAGTSEYSAAETTMTVTVDPAAKDVNDLAVTTLGVLSMNAKETKSLSECITSPAYSSSSHGAISYSSSNTDVITVNSTTGEVTAKSVAEETSAYVLVSQAEDATYAASAALQYVKVTVIPAAKENVNGKTKNIELDYVGPNEWNSGHWYKADVSGFSVNSETTVTNISLTNISVDKYCYNISNWGGQTGNNTLDASFVTEMFKEGYLYIHVYAKATDGNTPTISMTFSD